MKSYSLKCSECSKMKSFKYNDCPDCIKPAWCNQFPHREFLCGLGGVCTKQGWVLLSKPGDEALETLEAICQGCLIKHGGEAVH